MKLKLRKTAVISGGRADYGLLQQTMKRIRSSSKLQLQLYVTGNYGECENAILNDGLDITARIPCLIADRTPQSASASMGLGIIGFSQAFAENTPDILLVLGDRYEILAAVCAAIPMRIPIAHISGGEVTLGAFDDQIRNMITKAAHLHFPGAEEYAQNLLRMGEEPWRIINAGDPGIENIILTDFIPKPKLFKLLNIPTDRKTLLATFHPTTMNSVEQEKKDASEFFGFLKTCSDFNVVITHPNADPNSGLVLAEIEKISHCKHVRVFENLGSQVYLSLMKESAAILGNSSSALIEAPFLRIPTINIGDRQKGRLQTASVVSTGSSRRELEQALRYVLEDHSFSKALRTAKSLYGEGETSRIIVETLEKIPIDAKLLEKQIAAGVASDPDKLEYLHGHCSFDRFGNAKAAKRQEPKKQ